MHLMASQWTCYKQKVQIFQIFQAPLCAAQWFIIGRGQSSCPPHNSAKYRPEKDPKVTKHIFSLILSAHWTFVGAGKKPSKFFSCLEPCLCLVVRTVVILVCLIYYIDMSLSLLKMQWRREALALADQQLNHSFLRDFIDDGFEEDCYRIISCRWKGEKF